MTDIDRSENTMVVQSPSTTDRWKSLDFGPPASDVEETEPSVLVDYRFGRAIAIIT